MDEAISVARLTKSFGRIKALDGLDLQVKKGEVHGFLGPNGAGKSTTIRILLGLARADSGAVRLLGGDPWTDATRLHRRLSYVPGDVTLWPGMTGGQCVDILAAVHGGLRPERRTALIERFGLDPRGRAKDYSKGNRQKVALVAALASDSELLVLDEPTSGLDPLREQVFQECVRERRDAGCTVLLSSHILGEVEALADRVSIIRQGRTVQTGSLTDLRRHTRTTVQAVTRSEPVGLADVAQLDGLTFDADAHGVATTFTVLGDSLDEAVGVLHTAGIVTMTSSPPSLDALFLDSYRKNPTKSSLLRRSVLREGPA